jgi:hypothetical protein
VQELTCPLEGLLTDRNPRQIERRAPIFRRKLLRFLEGAFGGRKIEPLEGPLPFRQQERRHLAPYIIALRLLLEHRLKHLARKAELVACRQQR